jgi:hypothetical protein
VAIVAAVAADLGFSPDSFTNHMHFPLVDDLGRSGTCSILYRVNMKSIFRHLILGYHL